MRSPQPVGDCQQLCIGCLTRDFSLYVINRLRSLCSTSHVIQQAIAIWKGEKHRPLDGRNLVKKAVREKGDKTKSANVNCAYQINLGAIYRWHKDDDKHQPASLQWRISVFPTNRSLQCKFSRLYSLVRVLCTNPLKSAQIYFNASDAKEKKSARGKFLSEQKASQQTTTDP